MTTPSDDTKAPRRRMVGISHEHAARLDAEAEARMVSPAWLVDRALTQFFAALRPLADDALVVPPGTADGGDE